MIFKQGDLEKVTEQLSEVAENFTTLATGLGTTLDRYSLQGFVTPANPLQHAGNIPTSHI